MAGPFLDMDGVKAFKSGCDGKYLTGSSEKSVYNDLSNAKDPTWNQMFASGKELSDFNGGAFTVLRFGNTAPNDYMPGGYASGFLVRGADTYAFYGCAYHTPKVFFCGGNHNNGGTYKPVWGFSIIGSNKHTYNLDNLNAISSDTINALF